MVCMCMVRMCMVCMHVMHILPPLPRLLLTCLSGGVGRSVRVPLSSSMIEAPLLAKDLSRCARMPFVCLQCRFDLLRGVAWEIALEVADAFRHLGCTLLFGHVRQTLATRAKHPARLAACSPSNSNSNSNNVPQGQHSWVTV